MDDAIQIRSRVIVAKDLLHKETKYIEIHKKVSLKRVKSLIAKELKCDDFELKQIEGKVGCFKLVLDDKKYFAKVFYKQEKEIIEILKTIFKEKRYLRYSHDVYIVIEDFIELKKLEDVDDKTITNPLIYNSLADYLHNNYHDHVFDIKNKNMLLIAYKHALSVIENQHFKNVDIIIKHIKKCDIPTCRNIIHSDLTPSNILVGSDEGYIIDAENIQTGHPYEDFSYLMLFGDKYPNFVSRLINTYFKNNVPGDFWKTASLFVLMRYVINLSETYQNVERDIIDKNTENIIREYIEKEVPSWWTI